MTPKRKKKEKKKKALKRPSLARIVQQLSVQGHHPMIIFLTPHMGVVLGPSVAALPPPSFEGRECSPPHGRGNRERD
jgi:hypothetical protein